MLTVQQAVRLVGRVGVGEGSLSPFADSLMVSAGKELNAVVDTGTVWTWRVLYTHKQDACQGNPCEGKVDACHMGTAMMHWVAFHKGCAHMLLLHGAAYVM